MTLKLCQLKNIKLGTFLWKNHAENVHQKLILDLFVISENNIKQPLLARSSLKISFFETKLSKSL